MNDVLFVQFYVDRNLYVKIHAGFMHFHVLPRFVKVSYGWIASGTKKISD